MTLSFDQFRRKLADVVTVAINSGRRCGSGDGCGCPLAMHPGWLIRADPDHHTAAAIWQIRTEIALGFVLGFDGHPTVTPRDQSHPAAFALGRAYRARFVGGGR